MAITPQNPGPSIEDTFLADRARFWGGFTSFTKYSVIGLVVLMLAMYVFLV